MKNMKLKFEMKNLCLKHSIDFMNCDIKFNLMIKFSVYDSMYTKLLKKTNKKCKYLYINNI